MFGGRKRRVAKLSAGVARNLETGESIRELVQTQTGQSAAANASAVMESGFVGAQRGTFYRARVKAGPHVLVATDRNLYAMTLSGACLLDDRSHADPDICGRRVAGRRANINRR